MSPVHRTLAGTALAFDLREEMHIVRSELEGAIVVRAGSESHPVPAGGLLPLDGGVRHDVSSAGGGMFLSALIVGQSPRA